MTCLWSAKCVFQWIYVGGQSSCSHCDSCLAMKLRPLSIQGVSNLVDHMQSRTWVRHNILYQNSVDSSGEINHAIAMDIICSPFPQDNALMIKRSRQLKSRYQRHRGSPQLDRILMIADPTASLIRSRPGCAVTAVLEGLKQKHARGSANRV